MGSWQELESVAGGSSLVPSLQTYQVSSIRIESQAFGLNIKLSRLMVSVSSILAKFAKKKKN